MPQIPKNILVAFAITFSVLIIGLLAWFAFFPKSDTTNQITEGIEVNGYNNQPITVRDFSIDSYFQDSDVTVITQSDSFVTQFDKKSNVFQIALTVTSADQLEAARMASESDLKNKLGVDDEQFCNLNVVQTVLDNGVVTLPQYTYRPLSCEN